MSDLLAAHSQMAVSLGFHIVFAVIGIAMPVLMVVAEGRLRDPGGRRLLALPSLLYLFRIFKTSPADPSVQAAAGE